MTDTAENPMAIDGFEFVEYAAPDPAALGTLFESPGFAAAARHRSKDVTLYRQGGVNFIVNAEPGSFAQAFARVHGPSVCVMAFRVRDAGAALKRAVGLGARPFRGPVGPMELAIPAIHGIGDSLIYLVDRYGERTIYDVDFVADAPDAPEGVGLTVIDHLTHNVHRGRMDEWAHFYERLFGFREIRFLSRDDIRPGMVTLHPAGVPHGPHPKAYQTGATAGRKGTDEVAVMIDARDALDVAELPAGVEWEGYVESWKGGGG